MENTGFFACLVGKVHREFRRGEDEKYGKKPYFLILTHSSPFLLSLSFFFILTHSFSHTDTVIVLGSSHTQAPEPKPPLRATTPATVFPL